MSPVRYIENVPYYRHVISFTLDNGRRRRVVVLTPDQAHALAGVLVAFANVCERQRP